MLVATLGFDRPGYLVMFLISWFKISGKFCPNTHTHTYICTRIKCCCWVRTSSTGIWIFTKNLRLVDSTNLEKNCSPGAHAALMWPWHCPHSRLQAFHFLLAGMKQEHWQVVGFPKVRRGFCLWLCRWNAEKVLVAQILSYRSQNVSCVTMAPYRSFSASAATSHKGDYLRGRITCAFFLSCFRSGRP